MPPRFRKRKPSNLLFAGSFRFGRWSGCRLLFWFWKRRERLLKTRHVLGAARDRDGRAFEVVAHRFEAAAELLGQERFRDGVKRLVVLGSVEAVAFVWVEH